MLWVGVASLWVSPEMHPFCSEQYLRTLVTGPQSLDRGLVPSLQSVLQALLLPPDSISSIQLTYHGISIQGLFWGPSLFAEFPTLLSLSLAFSPAGKFTRIRAILFAWWSPGEPCRALFAVSVKVSPLPNRRGRFTWRGSLLVLQFSYYIGNKNKLSGLTLAKSSLASIHMENWGLCFLFSSPTPECMLLFCLTT